MSEGCSEILDPRVRRTRQLLQQALGKLLETKDFEKISVQDIAEASTVNRATFYDHYSDKFALLRCMVGERFGELLAQRQVHFDGGCSSALGSLVRCVCDYLAAMPGSQIQPHMETAIIQVVRSIVLDGARRHPPASGVSPELFATTVSWAIFGAAKEWLATANRCSAEEISGTILRLLGPIFSVAPA
jgi:AcrR family transcriptional regulator